VKKIAIVGTVRNVESSLRRIYKVLQKSFNLFEDIRFFLVESDSTDRTLAELELLKTENRNFDYVSLGNLDCLFPVRTMRMARVRNEYLHEIQSNPLYSGCDYVAVADFDEVNSRLTSKAVASCFTRNDWDGVFANQKKRYYDIYALRHTDWSPTDPFFEFNALIESGVGKKVAWNQAVLRKQRRIPSRGEWISVQSAFGGLAIYKRSFLEGRRYSGLTPQGLEICEHVPFHTSADSEVALYINPSLINSYWTRHTSQHRFSRRIVHASPFLVRLAQATRERNS